MPSTEIAAMSAIFMLVSSDFLAPDADALNTTGRWFMNLTGMVLAEEAC